MDNSFSTLKSLMVDDDKVMQLIVHRELTALGIQVTTASNGEEALRIMEHQTFDFVLMDIRMPGQDGLDTIRWIRELDDRTKDTLIFALTSFSTPEHTKELEAAGFNEHFIKPLDIPVFTQTLKKYFWALP